MTDPGPLRRARENLAGLVAVLVTGIWLAALVTDQSWWLAFMLFGYVVLVPVVSILFVDDEEDEDVATGREGPLGEPIGSRESAGAGREGDALATLRERYARGELTDEQFERKLDRLMETETLEDLEDLERRRDAADAADAPRGDAGTGVGADDAERSADRTR